MCSPKAKYYFFNENNKKRVMSYIYLFCIFKGEKL